MESPKNRHSRTRNSGVSLCKIKIDCGSLLMFVCSTDKSQQKQTPREDPCGQEGREDMAMTKRDRHLQHDQ